MIDFDTLPHDLREAVSEYSGGAQIAPNAARSALASTYRRQRRARIAGLVAALVVVGAGVGGVVAAEQHHQATHGVQELEPLSSYNAPHLPAGTTLTRPTLQDKGQSTRPSKALDRVSLPSPAPGFPHWRGAPVTIMTSGLEEMPGSAYSTTFLVTASDQDCVKPVTSPVEVCRGTGPEATIEVTQGPLPTTPDNDDRVDGEKVVATSLVNGHLAYVTTDPNSGGTTGGSTQTHVFFKSGSLRVFLAGEGASIADLLTLAASIHGIDN